MTCFYFACVSGLWRSWLSPPGPRFTTSIPTHPSPTFVSVLLPFWSCLHVISHVLSWLFPRLLVSQASRIVQVQPRGSSAVWNRRWIPPFLCSRSCFHTPDVHFVTKSTLKLSMSQTELDSSFIILRNLISNEIYGNIEIVHGLSRRDFIGVVRLDAAFGCLCHTSLDYLMQS